MWTEQTIQTALYLHFQRQQRWPIFCNMDCITGYEADLLTITRSGFAYEYEIKRSKSDLKADAKKINKWASLTGNTKQIPSPHATDNTMIHVLKESPDHLQYWELNKYQCWPDRRPRQFWYVISGFEPIVSEIPTIAGIMTITEPQAGKSLYHSKINIVRKAQVLEASPVPEKDLLHATSNMLYRYWHYRTTKDWS